ncbi:unnamed protein product [Gongylonema pulchrum]|uniref:Uncharacterized protein n=1 Tax=Gongylonema pulchrum TaxID=637853 RepID=A0A183D5M5_9BILA|nr:unnamed protein product [Gongylonema pulchrum]
MAWLYSAVFKLLSDDNRDTSCAKVQQTITERSDKNAGSQQQAFATADPSAPVNAVPDSEQPVAESGEFYSRKQCYPRDFEGEYDSAANHVIAPPAAPVAPSVLPAFTSISSTTFTKASETPNIEKVAPKGGVAVLPPDILAEAHVRVKEREKKLNESRTNEILEACLLRPIHFAYFETTFV